MKRVAGLDVHKETIFASLKKGRYQSEVKEFDTTTCITGFIDFFHLLPHKDLSIIGSRGK